MDVTDQIAMHTNTLRRWFSEKVAQRRAAEYVDTGQAWLWPENAAPAYPMQQELFLALTKPETKAAA